MKITKQNESHNLRKLAAQRELYSKSKYIFGWQLVLSFPVIIIFSMITLMYPPFKIFAAFWALALTFSDIFFITPWQKRIRESAARIQESFDCEVFDLEWNKIKVGKEPEPELIKEESERYKKSHNSMMPIHDWYPAKVKEVPVHIGRLICQRSNCWWDSKQRRKYALSIIPIVGMTLLILIILSMNIEFTLDNIFLKILAPMSPVFVLGVRQYNEQMDAAARLDKLKDQTDKVWENALSGAPIKLITLESRNIQDEIFENRKKNPPVFDFVFKSLRDDYEAQMNFGAEHYITEVKKKMS